MIDELITYSNVKHKAVIVPIEIFKMLTHDSKLPELWEPVPFEAGKNDEVIILGEVVSITIKKDVTLHAAWRIYRKLTQKQVAEAMGITQASVSAIEKSEKPRDFNLAKLTELYDCQLEQLTD